MQISSTTAILSHKRLDASHRFAFICVTSLFFLWGLAYGLLDVLNKHFQETLNIGKAESAWLQVAYFGAYFLISWPAAWYMSARGYKQGILLGLGLYAVGAFLFIPASHVGSFAFFVGALFVLASGLACLETAANPYITVLGPPETAERRLNLSQSFNGVGSFLGPIIGGSLFFPVNQHVSTGDGANLGAVRWTYAAIGVLVLAVGVVIARTHLPDIRSEDTAPAALEPRSSMWNERHFVWGVVALFFYVAAQVGVGAFFINLATEAWPGLNSARAAYLLSVGMVLFLSGRFLTTALMTHLQPRSVLSVYAIVNVALTIIVAADIRYVSVIALLGVFFFMSIMFPTIFSLGIRRLGSNTKRGASAMVASIVGGALLPYVTGKVAQDWGTASSYLLCTVCFAVVAGYGLRGAVIRDDAPETERV